MTKGLVDAFYEAAIFLKGKVDSGEWKVFSSNYLREHVRCRFGLSFSNTVSPEVLDAVVKRHPELRRWIKTNSRKNGLFG